MSITIEAIYEGGMLKPLAPLPGLSEHTKVWITVEVIADTEPHGSVIDAQRHHRLHPGTRAARDIGDSHEYDLLES
jgi:predicted DNA-binding antitoxin AbrB/MazE fold protein